MHQLQVENTRKLVYLVFCVKNTGTMFKFGSLHFLVPWRSFQLPSSCMSLNQLIN